MQKSDGAYSLLKSVFKITMFPDNVFRWAYHPLPPILQLRLNTREQSRNKKMKVLSLQPQRESQRSPGLHSDSILSRGGHSNC
jgi:hypothetical protein